MTVHQHTSSTSTSNTARPAPDTRTRVATGAERRTPSRPRRAAILGAAVVACALPAVWTVNLSRMLATGDLAEHRFHQLTGQGLLLIALWLGSLVPMLLAAWRGRRPGGAPALLHLSFVAVGTACALAAPQGGARELMAVIAGTGVVVWLALPLRARLRTRTDVAPVSLALALLAAAVVAPYAVDQIALQHAATGHHAQNPHYFDMAWFTLVLALVGVQGALLPTARALQAVAGAGLAATGAAMLALDQGIITGTLFTVVGALLAAAWFVTSRHEVLEIRRDDTRP